MPEPISSIIALTNLTTKLVSSITDRKFATELREIQTLISTLQSEHIAINNENLEIKSNNFELKQKLSTLESLLSETQKENSKLIKELEIHYSNKKDYKMKWGCILFEGDPLLYCPSCYLDRKKKRPTSRDTFSARYCTSCKTSIPSQ